MFGAYYSTILTSFGIYSAVLIDGSIQVLNSSTFSLNSFLIINDEILTLKLYKILFNFILTQFIMFEEEKYTKHIIESDC